MTRRDSKAGPTVDHRADRQRRPIAADRSDFHGANRREMFAPRSKVDRYQDPLK